MKICLLVSIVIVHIIVCRGVDLQDEVKPKQDCAKVASAVSILVEFNRDFFIQPLPFTCCLCKL